MKQLMKELDEAVNNLDQPKVVKLGDASIASPFTSRHSSIECSELFWYMSCYCVLTVFLLFSLSCHPTRSLYISDNSANV